MNTYLTHTKIKSGFTLIELLIAVSIIGILVAVLLPAIIDAPMKARDAARIAAVNEAIAAVVNAQSDMDASNLDISDNATGTLCLNSTLEEVKSYYTKPGLPSFSKYETITSDWTDPPTSDLKCTDAEGKIYPVAMELADGYVVMVPVENVAKANANYFMAGIQRIYNSSAPMTKAEFLDFIKSGDGMIPDSPAEWSDKVFAYAVVR